MKKLCEEIHWKTLNLAFWIEIILSYFLPFERTDHFQYPVGFPAPFLFVRDGGLHGSPFMSMAVNPLGLLFDVMILYWLIGFCVKVYQRIRHSHT